MSAVRNIVFDLGRVLVDFSMEKCFDFLAKRGLATDNISKLIEDIELHEYEHGRISSEKFLNNINALLPEKISHEELGERWNDIFTPCEDMFELMARIRKKHPVFILSNTSELHWDYLKENYRIDKRADGLLASFEVGAMKPALEIYRAAEREWSISPQSSVFIDDIEENAKGAVAAGWHGIHHTGITSTVTQLKALGLQLD